MAQGNCRPLACVFGSIVAVKRKALDMSQEKLAEMVGITQVALSRMEKGIIAPRFERLQDFADALNCPVAELFPGKSTASAMAGLIADMLTPLPKREQKEIVEVVARIIGILRDRGQPC
jgi:transcriptional regulator with XRE-family HTH domain